MRIAPYNPLEQHSSVQANDWKNFEKEWERKVGNEHGTRQAQTPNNKNEFLGRKRSPRYQQTQKLFQGHKQDIQSLFASAIE